MTNHSFYTTDEIKELLGMDFPCTKYSLGTCSLLVGQYPNYGLCVQHLHRRGYDTVKVYDQIINDEGDLTLIPFDEFVKGDLDPED